MFFDWYIGVLFSNLIVSKLGGYFLELGMGIGFLFCWMIEGMD